MNVAPRLLLVEENLALARAFKRRASHAGWAVTHAATSKNIRNMIQVTSFEAWVISDIFEGQDGMRLVREHEGIEQSCRRPLRPRTALWSADPKALPADLDLYEMRLFFKMDVPQMLEWLAEGVRLQPAFNSPVVSMFRR